MDDNNTEAILGHCKKCGFTLGAVNSLVKQESPGTYFPLSKHFSGCHLEKRKRKTSIQEVITACPRNFRVPKDSVG